MESLTFAPLNSEDQQNYNRFLKRITKFGSPRSNHCLSNCWAHLTVPSSAGYGQIMFQSKAWLIHVYSWWIHNGKPEKQPGYDVSHKCDNKECCNPEHLEYITHTQNVRDGVERVRVIKPKKEKKKGDYKATSASYKPGDQSGEKNTTAVLTWEKVKEIRAAHAAGLKYGDLKRLSETYCVTVRAIENVINHKSWKENISGKYI